MTEAQACLDAKPCDVNITGGNGRCHSVPRTTAEFPPPSVAPINRAFENLCGRLSVTKSNPGWQKSLVCPRGRICPLSAEVSTMARFNSAAADSTKPKYPLSLITAIDETPSPKTPRIPSSSFMLLLLVPQLEPHSRFT